MRSGGVLWDRSSQGEHGGRGFFLGWKVGVCRQWGRMQVVEDKDNYGLADVDLIREFCLGEVVVELAVVGVGI